MKYMALIASRPEPYEGMSREEQGALYGRIEAWWRDHEAAGRILEGHQLQPAETATTIRLDGGADATVTDGPFVEAKEVVGGYAIIDVPDLDAAIEMWRGWPAPDIVEIRPVVVGDPTAE